MWPRSRRDAAERDRRAARRPRRRTPRRCRGRGRCRQGERRTGARRWNFGAEFYRPAAASSSSWDSSSTLGSRSTVVKRARRPRQGDRGRSSTRRREPSGRGRRPARELREEEGRGRGQRRRDRRGGAGAGRATHEGRGGADEGASLARRTKQAEAKIAFAESRPRPRCGPRPRTRRQGGRGRAARSDAGPGRRGHRQARDRGPQGPVELKGARGPFETGIHHAPSLIPPPSRRILAARARKLDKGPRAFLMERGTMAMLRWLAGMALAGVVTAASAASGPPMPITQYETPSEQRWAPFFPDLPGCDDPSVLSLISGRFGEARTPSPAADTASRASTRCAKSAFAPTVFRTFPAAIASDARPSWIPASRIPSRSGPTRSSTTYVRSRHHRLGLGRRVVRRRIRSRARLRARLRRPATDPRALDRRPRWGRLAEGALLSPRGPRGRRSTALLLSAFLR